MKRLNWIRGNLDLGAAAFATTLLLFVASASAATETQRQIVKGPCDLQGQDSETRTDAIQIIVLAGDPDQPGPYAVRLKIPPQFKIAPHFHTDDTRFVTVLSGTLYYGVGKRFDAERLRPMSPGTFFTEPPGLRHFAMTRCEEVMLQLDAIGPTGTVVLEDQHQD